jgi:hypothetical protein
MAIPRNLANLANQLNTDGEVPKIEVGDSKVEVTDTGSNGTIVFNTDGSEAMRIDASRRVLVNTTSSYETTGALQVNGRIVTRATSGPAVNQIIEGQVVDITNLSTANVSGPVLTSGSKGMYVFQLTTIGAHIATFLVSVGLQSGANAYYTAFAMSSNATLTQPGIGEFTVVLAGDARTYTISWATDGSPGSRIKASSTATGTTRLGYIGFLAYT